MEISNNGNLTNHWSEGGIMSFHHARLIAIYIVSRLAQFNRYAAGLNILSETQNMADKSQTPWASGSGEILKHALDLLKGDSDTKRRLAMISVDNAVELMMKTYLGLPKRVTGLTITRKEFQEFSESFPKLLDALEKYASDKLDGIDLGEIEWYHRLRNEMYHQGNGLTVERDKVEVYAELANVLFTNLFGFRLVEHKDKEAELLGNFIAAWSDFEKALMHLASLVYEDTGRRPLLPFNATRLLHTLRVISRPELEEIDQLRMIRNKVVHGEADKTDLKPQLVKRLRELTSEFERRHKAVCKSAHAA
jgi:hypothetical protein